MVDKNEQMATPRYREGDEVIITKGILWGQSLAGRRCIIKHINPKDKFPYTVDIGEGFVIHVGEDALELSE